MLIQNNISQLKSNLPKNVTLIAVSKTKPIEDVQAAYNGGQRVFGENYIQELVEKQGVLPQDIQWHFIGHLQSNKVKYIAPFINMVHAVDSMKLLKEINKQAIKNNRIIDCLLQVHIADEDNKFGLTRTSLINLIQSEEFFALKHVRIRGLMGMATFTDDKTQVRSEFQSLYNLFELIKSKHFKFADYFNEISMGMSGDYQIAIEEGSTMIRVGSAIFGAREYAQN